MWAIKLTNSTNTKLAEPNRPNPTSNYHIQGRLNFIVLSAENRHVKNPSQLISMPQIKLQMLIKIVKLGHSCRW